MGHFERSFSLAKGAPTPKFLNSHISHVTKIRHKITPIIPDELGRATSKQRTCGHFNQIGPKIYDNIAPYENFDLQLAYHHKKDEERDPDWSYSAIPQEVSAHVDQFKLNMTQCLKEVQANDKRTIRRLSPKSPADSPIHGECLIACVLKRNGVIEGNKINKGNLLSLVGKFYAKDTKLMKKLEKNIDRCIEMSIRVKDECALAAHLNDCTNDLMASNKHKIVVNYK